MSDAVLRSFAAAEDGDSVLLAPACSSFDMFSSFEHRGRVFTEAVRNIENSGIRNQDSGLRSQDTEEDPETSFNRVLSSGS